MSRPVVVLAMRGAGLRDALFPPDLRERLTTLAEWDPELVVADFAAAPAPALAAADVLLTGWGCPRVDAAVLDRMPRLRLVAHAAGTVKGHVDPVCWELGVAVTTAAAANALPVVEFALAQILLAGKDLLGATARYATGTPRAPHEDGPLVGNYGRVVGVIGASTIGRGVLERLRAFDLRLLLADPTITADEAERLGAELVDLDTLMARSDVVSLHAPLLPGTVGMVGAAQLAAMRDGTTFINTARGRIVDHEALRRELRTGRISAMLDVTEPEPLEPGDELFALPNVLLTPHIAGSMGNELHRMAALALDEVEHLAAGAPFRHPVHLEDLARMA
ncbi:Phosphoglycerate dehydrogenase [Friedmanniella luteola]|uniref:Phosphoglycerate dehydrogenase n=1 Tax=Friedmanniella luteola TaxID=546871 RepID=A0A1H2A2T0_9ACTN|nr:hydroxyacid dehydrogenase [Friedmanniella luteola]SDT39796.1 Phosphoglycerate dehydrogenase [Friedmanniella luteola]